MDYDKMIDERKQKMEKLISEIQRIDTYKKQLEKEVIRLQGEQRLLNELKQKNINNEKEDNKQ